MSYLSDMIWVEGRKVVRSRLPLLTGLGFLFMPLASAFMILIFKDPELARRLGVVSAKANLLIQAADWPAYLKLVSQAAAAGGFFLFCLVTSWVFGREFADHTLKDWLAVPVPRFSILLAKFIVIAVWSLVLVIEIYLASLALGVLMQLPGGTLAVVLHGSAVLAQVTVLSIVTITPFAFLASVGRGYLLPLGIALLIAVVANVSAVIGWGEYVPWSVAGLLTQDIALRAISYWIVLLTGLAGVLVTYLWWMRADQSR